MNLSRLLLGLLFVTSAVLSSDTGPDRPDITILSKGYNQICVAGGNTQGYGLAFVNKNVTHGVSTKYEFEYRNADGTEIDSAGNCNFEDAAEDNCKYRWIKNGLQLAHAGTMNLAPVLDERWNNFELRHTDAIYDPNHYNTYKISYKIPPNFFITFSVRSKMDAQILLCSSQYPKNEECYWIIIDGFDNQEITAIRKCVGGVPDRYATGKEPDCKKIREQIKIPGKLLHESEWTHFILSRVQNHRIRLWSWDEDNKNRLLLDYKDNKEKPIDVKYMFVRTYNSIADWKIHLYKYIEIRQPQKLLLMGPALNFSSTVCISFYIVMCQKCSMLVRLEREDGKTIMETTLEGNSEEKFMTWRNVRLESPTTLSSNILLYLYVTLNTTDETYKNPYWAFDDFRKCSSNEIRIATIYNQNEVVCQSLRYPNWTFDSRKQIMTNEPPICEETSYFGQHCNISCNILSRGGCEDHKICLPTLEGSDVGACTCASGNKWEYNVCTNRCIQGSNYGYNCENTCGYCRYNSCDRVTGKCSKGCEQGYQLPLCKYSYPRFIHPLMVTDIQHTSISVKFVDTSIDGPQNMMHRVLIECKKQYDTKWFNCSEPIEDVRPELEITISNLEVDTLYDIRAVIYTENGDTYNYKDLPYTNATTSCELFKTIQITAKSRNATIYFEPSADGCRLENYRIKLEQNNKVVKRDENVQQNMVLKDLAPYKTYEVELTHVQYTSFFLKANFETEQDEPGKVSDFQLKDTSNREVLLSWNKPEEENGIIQHYIVTYQLVQYISCKESVTSEPKILVVRPEEISNVHISGLEPYATYYLKVAAETIKQGDEIWYYFNTSISDDISDDELPESISATDISANSATIRWQAANCMKQKGPLYFNIILQCVKNEWCDKIPNITINTNINSKGYTTHDLTPYTNYVAELRAKRHQNGQLSTFSRTIEFATFPGNPSSVRNLTAYSKDKASISIRWLNPSPPQGNLEYFEIKYCYHRFYERCDKINKITSEKLLPCDLWNEDFNCFMLTKLFSEYVYTITVWTKNKESKLLSPEKVINIKTQEGISQVPLNLTREWKDNELNLFWNHPYITNGRIKKFIIILKPNKTELTNLNEIGPYSYEYKITEEMKNYKYTIEKSFRYSSSYILTICAVNLCYGENATLIIDTPPETPELASNLMIENERIRNTSITLTIPGAKKNTKSKKSFLYVVVSTRNKTLAKREAQNENSLKEDILKHAEHRNKWIAIERKLSEEQIEVAIGDDTVQFSKNLNENIYNKKLEPSTEYALTVVAVNLYREQRSTFHYSSHFQTTATTVSSGAIYALLLLLLLPIVGFFIYRYISKNEMNRTSTIISRLRGIRSESSQTMTKTISEDQHEPDVIPLTEGASEPSITKPKKPATAPKPGSSKKVPENVEPKTENATESNFFHSRPVLLENLEDYLKEVLENGELEQQHALFPRGQTKPWDYGMLKPNKFKNRYNNLVAYDENRVKLEKIGNDQYSDYINANYIHGYRQDKAYIATQGPKLTTVNDFWRMIWQEKSQYIIMLANVVEAGKKKCEKYWPDIDSSRSYGNIEVYFVKSELYADFEYRTFELKCKGEKRKVYQLHFTSWPDHGVPIYPQSLVPFLKKMLTVPQSTAPVVVHCSAGVGRTGTIILCDICLRMAAREKAIDVLRYLHEIREQRANMVDNVDQYKLVHMVLLECLLAPDTNIPCNAELSTSIQKLIEEGGLQIQLNYLQQSAWKDKALNFVSAKKPNPVNESKNRFNDIIPLENQIYISRYPASDEHSDYINAVPVDGFRFKEQFIVTQLPMPNTVKDFWRMIAEKSVKVIVSLNDIPTNDPTCCKFWPEENEELEPVPNINLKYHKIQQNEFYDVYSIILDDKAAKEARMIQIVQFKNWKHGNKLPENEDNLVMLWEETETLCLGNYPMVVTCYDGATASGLFVAMSFVIEKIKLEQQCDPCLAVRVIRRNRKQFVSNKMQFEFLYRSAVIYLSMFETYSNFQPVIHKN